MSEQVHPEVLAERERLANLWRGLPVWGPNEQGLHILDDVAIESLMDDLWDHRPKPHRRQDQRQETT